MSELRDRKELKMDKIILCYYEVSHHHSTRTASAYFCCIPDCACGIVYETTLLNAQ